MPPAPVVPGAPITMLSSPASDPSSIALLPPCCPSMNRATRDPPCWDAFVVTAKWCHDPSLSDGSPPESSETTAPWPCTANPNLPSAVTNAVFEAPVPSASDENPASHILVKGSLLSNAPLDLRWPWLLAWTQPVSDQSWPPPRSATVSQGVILLQSWSLHVDSSSAQSHFLPPLLGAVSTLRWRD